MASFFKKFLKKIELSSDHQINRWINEDIAPIPPERQTWNSLQYVQLWILVFSCIPVYQTGAAMIATGLSWWQAIIAILVGNTLAACFAVLNSVSGAKSHLGFPIVSRSLWGMYGALFPILNRMLLSTVWYGVQAVIGGKMIYVCLRAIWPGIDTRIPNTFPKDLGMTTAQFVGYIIFNVLCCGLIWFRPTQLRPYFHVASIMSITALFSLLGWAMGTSHEFGAVLAATKSTKAGSALGWTICSAIMSVIGSISAAILNQNDYTRFAKRVNQVTWPQGISFGVSASVTGIIGVLVTTATQDRYGKGTPLWDPSALLAAVQDNGDSGARAGTFFLAFAFTISQLSINVPGNVLAGGLDVASVLPKYVNLRRGAYVLAFVSVLPQPWKQVASGSTFLNVLSAYSVFVGPIIGLQCVHYYVIQKERFVVPDLYEGSSRSTYWYTYGINWRSVVAWACAVVPSMPGFIHAVNPGAKVGPSATKIYSLCFVLGFVLAALFAYVLHWIFPVQYPDMTVVLEAWPSHEVNRTSIIPEKEDMEKAPGTATEQP